MGSYGVAGSRGTESRDTRHRQKIIDFDENSALEEAVPRGGQIVC